MRGVKSFLEERLPEMFDYILVVSTPGSEESSQPPSEEAHIRNRAIKALSERKQAMPELQRESIPSLPHFLDVPRHLAIITSAIARYSRDLSVPQDPAMADLYNRCRDVEQQALYRVSRHVASRGGAEGFVVRPLPSPEHSLTPSIGNHSTVEEPWPLSRKRPSSKTPSSRSRPRTAPSGTASDPSLYHYASSHGSREFPPFESKPSTGTGAGTSRVDERDSLRERPVSRPRSASTDSTPEPVLGGTNPARKSSLVDILRPQNAERKKGFFRNILGSK
jgi:hypothetical protein